MSSWNPWSSGGKGIAISQSFSNMWRGTITRWGNWNEDEVQGGVGKVGVSPRGLLWGRDL